MAKTAVGSPLIPRTLFEIEAFTGFPPVDTFQPAGPWTLTYRIWTCHGYREFANNTVGFVRLHRSTTGQDRTFTLDVHQEIKNYDTSLNRIAAKIQCREDALSTPEKWTCTSTFMTPKGKKYTLLAMQTDGTSAGKEITLTHKKQSRKIACESRPTCDWCLWESLQRAKNGLPATASFEMLEGLEIRKPQQQLIDRGTSQIAFGDTSFMLRRVDHLGVGNLPFEYWVDDSSRLLLASSSNKVYILDDQAEATFKELLKNTVDNPDGDEE